MKDPFAVLARCLGALCALVSLATAWGGGLLWLAGYNGLIEPNLAARGAALFPLALQHLPWSGAAFDRALIALNSAIAVLGAALYCRPRSALLAALLYGVFVSFKQTVPLLAYGMFEFLQMGLFYLMVANIAGAIGTRRAAMPSSSQPSVNTDGLVGLFLRGHIALAYFSSGLSKAVGPQWWTGDSLWRALARTDSTGQRWFDMAWLGHFPWVLQGVGIATVVLELFYPLAFWRRARPVFVAGLIAMHLGTILFQGLTLFGLTMIALNVFFWLDSERSRPAPTFWRRQDASSPVASAL